jgi:hypothetical protein
MPFTTKEPMPMMSFKQFYLLKTKADKAASKPSRQSKILENIVFSSTPEPSITFRGRKAKLPAN